MKEKIKDMLVRKIIRPILILYGLSMFSGYTMATAHNFRAAYNYHKAAIAFSDTEPSLAMVHLNKGYSRTLVEKVKEGMCYEKLAKEYDGKGEKWMELTNTINPIVQLYKWYKK